MRFFLNVYSIDTHLQPIVDRIISKLASWKGSLLSIIGMVELVKSVIHNMLLYSFHVYMWPINLIKYLDKCIRNFIWSGNIYTRKLVTVAWHRSCSPLMAGCLGIQSLRALNEAAILKLSWEMMASDKEWAVFLRSRFTHANKPVVKYVKSTIWPGIKINMHTVLSSSVWQLGDGTTINFWLDNYLDEPLVDLLLLEFISF